MLPDGEERREQVERVVDEEEKELAHILDAVDRSAKARYLCSYIQYM